MRKIKVIKRKNKESRERDTGQKAKGNNPREMVNNVKTWVNDFRVKKQEETQTALESLFGNTPQNMES